MLLTGLLASVCLHGVLFDLWRGRSGGDPVPARVMLNLHLQTARLAEDSSVEGTQPVPSPVVEQAVRATEGYRTPGRHAPRGDSVQRSVGEETQTPSQAEMTQASDGWRPLSVEEGKVAYRLALLQALRLPPAALPDSGVLLELDLPVGGQAAAVRFLGGYETPSALRWLEAVQEAARRVTVPDVLRGQARRIELELLP